MSDGDIKNMKYISNCYDKDVRIKKWGYISKRTVKRKAAYTLSLLHTVFYG